MPRPASNSLPVLHLSGRAHPHAAAGGRRLARHLAAACLAALPWLVAPSAAAVETFDPRKVNVDDLEVADCILPGQIRSLGRMTYQTPRRLARLTRGECALKGGEAKIYDRTDTKSALDAWLPVAEQGDVEAMNRVALIYEGAYGGDPNLERAYAWYRRAAENGYKPAQFSLATMLEQGKGVEKNVMEALEWYRKASGIQNDSLRLSSDAKRELEELRANLEGQLKESQSQIDLLEAQIKNLQAEAASQGQRAAAAQAQVRTLSNLVAQLRRDAETKRTQLAAVPVFRTPSNVAAPTLSGPQLPVAAAARANVRQQLGNADMGKYYALVIGNQQYQHLEPLSTPVGDARRIADLLEQRYGFQVMLLLNANATTIKQAINELDRRATAKDNVLIYFAGHGVVRNLPATAQAAATAGRARTARANVQGFWLPVEAETARDTFWIDNMWVTEHLSLNHAKRVLVVADSCYAGLFSADPSVLLSDNPNYTPAEIQELVRLRSRFVLSSGDVKPVLDRGGNGGHSVFAGAFIDVLQSNQGVLSSVALYRDVFERVAVAARRQGIEQLPQLRPIRPAGHEWGEFFFVPRT